MATRTGPGQSGDKTWSRKITRLLRKNHYMYLHAPGTKDAVLGKKLYRDDVENPHSLHFDH